jgi:8-hydroxy-5-deazaflavin:NADPH oxidoreductase
VSRQMRIGVIGSGQVGQTLSQGFAKHGHDTRIASRSPAKLAEFSAMAGIQTGTFADVAAWAEAIVLAVKGDAAEAAVREAGELNLAGKLVIDTTNPIAHEPPEDGVLRFFTSPNESLMERLQIALPTVKFVKAFNSVGSALMVDPVFPGGAKPTMFYCGNDAGAKAVTARILEELGWDAADMGTAKAARAIEPLCQLWCIPGFRENAWTNHAFALLKR